MSSRYASLLGTELTTSFFMRSLTFGGGAGSSARLTATETADKVMTSPAQGRMRGKVLFMNAPVSPEVNTLGQTREVGLKFTPEPGRRKTAAVLPSRRAS